MSRIEPKVTSVYPPPVKAELSHEQLALRAYSKWLERGCPEGESEVDWHAAVAELNSEANPTSRAKSPRNSGKNQHPSAAA
ncbi:MAG TPA: DUF2934 domain-containing protein [Polyangiaceae bacterium]|nr:DUF2934 domain-containing protein [Polyangiaceae bacterium]